MPYFRPILWPTLFAVPAFCVLLALGTWQLERLEWKRDLLQRIDMQLAEPAEAFPQRSEWALLDPAVLEYRRFTVAGTFEHEHEIRWFAHSEKGGAGVHLLTPLRLRGGGRVIVDRGYVPQELADQSARPDSLVQGPVRITGIARASATAGPFDPANEPAANLWFVRNLEEIAQHIGANDLAPMFLEADDTPNPGSWPRGGQTRIDIPNNHLGYAFTWFGLAGTLLAIYIAYHVTQKRLGLRREAG